MKNIIIKIQLLQKSIIFIKKLNKVKKRKKKNNQIMKIFKKKFKLYNMIRF